ncbi:MAG TPA: hypothetical protein VJ865_09370, partial [Gemmatimonadaceae bacterium]|nr:hypothetical protein [Gemmatimonadaceae bacterium]
MKWLLPIVVALVLAGVAYEKLGERRDRRELPQVGRSIDIGGRSINVSCVGNGSPTVILDSGAGGPGYSWTNIQAQLAPLTRVCWFDRAGEGWSGGKPVREDGHQLASDLHALLQVAHVPGPYVLAG